MRSLFAKEIERRMRNDPDIYMLTGDLGFGVLDSIKDNCGRQFINAGIAEQNMMGVATGLACRKKRVFCYSITNFVTFRCLEQTKNGPCYHNLPVTIAAVGVGTPYNHYGYTHMGIEDVSVMRVLPNMRVYSPATSSELLCCLDEIFDSSSPSYLRLGKRNLPELEGNFVATGDGYSYWKPGLPGEIAIISTGLIAAEAVAAAASLAQMGVGVCVYSLYSLSPPPVNFIKQLLEHQHAVVVEEHVKAGGLFSILAENLAGIAQAPVLHSLSIAHESICRPASEAEVRRQNKLDAAGIVNCINQIGRTHA